MCISVFISTDLEVEAVPFSPEVGRFGVCHLPEPEEAVRAYFSKRNVYYIASHEDCGCGFEWDAEDKDEDPDLYELEWLAMSETLKEEVGWRPDDQRKWVAARQKTAQDLEDLLTCILQRTDEVEIGVFNDAEFQAPSSHRLVAPTDLSRGRPDVFPIVGTLYTVVAHGKART